MIVHTRLLGCFAVLITVQLQAQTPLSIKDARVIVTAHDFNRCDSFPGVGDFGWPGNIQRASNGDLLLVHSWGYWHASFASPRLLEKETYRRYKAIGWPVDFNAPTGGRALITRSSDNGNTWSKPAVVNDYYLDDGAYGLVKCQDGTLCCFVGLYANLAAPLITPLFNPAGENQASAKMSVLAANPAMSPFNGTYLYTSLYLS